MNSAQLSENLKKVRATINTYGSKKVRLIAVSKNFPIEYINCLIDNGHLEFGENYLQEAEEKMDEVGDGVIWHFIGSIQSRKAKRISELFDWVHTVDSLKVAKKLDTFRPIEKGPLNVCVQILSLIHI